MDSGPFSLLETMRLEDGTIRRRARHLARMAAAAAHFAYPWAPAAVDAALAAVVQAHGRGSWRLRLLLAPDGTPAVEATPYQADAHRWRVAFAITPVPAGDPFVLHKTTRRAVYDQARREVPGADDVLLWNERGEVTEFTFGNVVAEIDGTRVTPPVACGLLAGTFRGEQLAAGTLVERTLTRDDVAQAPRVWLINSVREWVEVDLAPVPWLATTTTNPATKGTGHGEP